ncbi:MAG: NFACT family protein [Methanobrevibacter arboriphilus]|uniref:Archaeal Rqc2 homolog aRqcH n=1 Tax=Methanobrevibacter arboriphilus TaxID=39441 RepID=A0A843AE60_METAZ|nr:ribosome rescue protein RqcH [Methanobrevibacter arboriphilus]MBF4468213.1 NFACT family protein [Methanobrevibacter arboriphilus]
MKTMSNVDINAICYELNEILEGARVDKSFQPTKDTVIMRFHVRGTGRVDVVFQAGVRIHTTRYPLDNPKIPPSFPMVLRKHLKGANIVSIKQHNFDRVVEIKIKKEKTYTLVIELFSKGNIILLDEAGNIVIPLKRKQWSDRDISSKKEYKYPPKRGINPLELQKKDLIQLFNDSNTDLIRTLARSGLGGVYSEEIVLRSGIDKKTISSNLGDEEINKIYETILDIFNPLKNHKINPNIVIRNDNVSDSSKDLNKINKPKEDVLPLNLQLYEDNNEYKREYFDTFNEAADEFFSKRIKDEIKSVQEGIWDKKVGKYEKRLKIQNETLNGFKNTIKVSKQKGDLLYANYSQIENLLNVIQNARSKEYPWKQIAKTLKDAKKSGMDEAQIVDSMDKLGNLVLDIDGEKISIDSKIPIPENAEMYYEKAKKAKRKIEGALIAIENTEKQLKKMEDKRDIAMDNIMVPQKRVKKELTWYEKLRWFVTSDNFLVIGGRDANTNEAVVKKYLDNNDIYLHSDIHGASSVVIKTEGNKVNDNTLKESAIFAASFSSAWSKNYGTQDVYWVNPDQVSKTPESGEFVAKGSFIIRGNRNHIRGLNLKIAVGIVDYEGKRIMAGPVDAVSSHTDNYVIIKPGYTKKEAIAKKILHKINEDNIISLDDVVRVLPSGKCDIVDS